MLQLLFALGNVQVGFCPYFAWQQTSQHPWSQVGVEWLGPASGSIFFFVKSGDFELQLPLRAVSQRGE